MADKVNGHQEPARSPLNGVLRQALAERPGGTVLPPGQLSATTADPGHTMGLAGLPGALAVEWAVIQALRDAVSKDIVAAEESEKLVSEEDRRELAISLVAKRVSAWAVAHAQTAAPLDARQLEQVRQAVLDALFKAGPLQPYLDDPDVENIVVDGLRVLVDSFDKPTREAPPIASTHEELVDLINRLAARSGHGERLLTPASPMVHFRLPDRSRVVATLLTSRPFMGVRRHRIMNEGLEQLLGRGTLSPALSAFLQGVVLAKRSLLVAGNMGSGKTTLLRALARKVPAGERIVTLESDRELFLDEDPPGGPHVLAMEARESNGERSADGRLTGQISIADMYPTSLRMLSDRVIVGEVRGVEAVSMLEAMSSGGRGSMCTLHADYPRLVLPRLVQLCQHAGMQVDQVNQLIANSVDFIVYLKQINQTALGGRRHRFVSHIWQITPGEGGAPAFTEVFGPDRALGEARAIPKVPPSAECLEELEDVGFDRRWLTEPKYGHWPQPMGLVNTR
ncbi:ATPase, T2SS/T4P/T4SS family [Streptomyces sp. T-3]|nr:ATPase, T2SS/T4P/T4SS family [Streptomyces sp. T-3]